MANNNYTVSCHPERAKDLKNALYNIHEILRSLRMTITVCFILIAFFQKTSAQINQQQLQKAKQLIEQKQYFTAFEILYLADSLHENPDLVLKKTEITLNFSTVSLLHRGFGFVNLEEGEILSDFMGQSEDKQIFPFRANEVLERLIAQNPTDYRLHKALGDFYYDCHLKYNNSWVKNTKELFGLINQYYGAANAHGQGDFLSYYVLGYIQTFEENYEAALPLFKKSIALSPDFPSAHYDLAHVHYYLDDKIEAIESARQAFILFSDSVRKADAARMVANIYSEEKIYKDAIIYYELSDSINPNNYLTTKQLIGHYLQTDNPKLIQTREKFFAFGPLNPSIYIDLSAIYVKENRTQDLIDFFEDKVSEYRKDTKVKANLYYYSGNLYLEFDEEKAAENLTKASKLFAKFLHPENRIFEMIDRTLMKL